ncbi:hypothetical protein SDC9_190471 [bioreactor metagenome]|uniref:Uncharacterized protein n=1 Tax=bioreactor metagenome TaxID=1076179 RepID=A0A645I622_9ZZZZ
MRNLNVIVGFNFLFIQHTVMWTGCFRRIILAFDGQHPAVDPGYLVYGNGEIVPTTHAFV